MRQVVKTVGKSGQISLGKAMAGLDFIMEELPGGDIMLKRAVVVPVNERWAHEPEMKAKLAQADVWMKHRISHRKPIWTSSPRDSHLKHELTVLTARSERGCC